MSLSRNIYFLLVPDNNVEHAIQQQNFETILLVILDSTSVDV